MTDEQNNRRVENADNKPSAAYDKVDNVKMAESANISHISIGNQSAEGVSFTREELEKLQKQRWFPLTLSICIGVLFFVILTHLSEIGSALSGFSGYFAAVLLGCVLAYMMNPLAMLFQRTIFKNFKRASWSLSVALTVLLVLTAISLLLVVLVPQLVGSISTFINNIDWYVRKLHVTIANLIGSEGSINPDFILDLYERITDKITEYLRNHTSEIISISTGILKNAVDWAIALILSIYLLAAKSSVKSFLTTLFTSALSDKHFEKVEGFLKRCNSILIKYIIYSLIECVIVGTINAIFMKIAGMQYVGLVSVVVALTNLIPTFGPVIGAAVGAFILLMVAPWQALVFLIFTLALQFVDGYIIKPRLFGNTLGVSGLLILISVVVMGNIFGVVGILLAIPAAAILDFVYEDAFLPYLKRRRKKVDMEETVQMHKGR